MRCYPRLQNIKDVVIESKRTHRQFFQLPHQSSQPFSSSHNHNLLPECVSPPSSSLSLPCSSLRPPALLQLLRSMAACPRGSPSPMSASPTTKLACQSLSLIVAKDSQAYSPPYLDSTAGLAVRPTPMINTWVSTANTTRKVLD